MILAVTVAWVFGFVIGMLAGVKITAYRWNKFVKGLGIDETLKPAKNERA